VPKVGAFHIARRRADEASSRAWLGRAHARSGNPAEARCAYEQFLDQRRNADRDRPLFREAKAEYAKLGS
jgi:hypothetical protein